MFVFILVVDRHFLLTLERRERFSKGMLNIILVATNRSTRYMDR